VSKQIIEQYLRTAEDEGRTLTDQEAGLVESLAAAAEQPQAAPSPVVAPAPPVQAAEQPSVSRRVLRAIEERQSLRIDAAAIAYETVKVAQMPAVSNNRLASWLLRHGAVDVGTPQGRTLQFPRLVAGNEAGAWTPGTAKAELPSELAEVPVVTFAGYTEIYETAKLDVPDVDGYLHSLITRRVIAAENEGLATSIKSQATTSTVVASSAVEAIAATIAQVESASPSSLVLLISADVWGATAGTGLVGQLGDGKYYEQHLMGVPYFVTPGVQSIVALDARAVGVTAAGPFILVAPQDATQNSVVIRSETSAAVVVSDPSAAGTITWTGRSTVK
jgi:hypothetical protein